MCQILLFFLESNMYTPHHTEPNYPHQYLQQVQQQPPQQHSANYQQLDAPQAMVLPEEPDLINQDSSAHMPTDTTYEQTQQKNEAYPTSDQQEHMGNAGRSNGAFHVIKVIFLSS